MIELDKVENCDMPLPDSFGKQYGWICPVCGKGLAPWVRECSCVNNNTINDITQRIYYTEPMKGYKYDELNQFNSITNGKPEGE